MEIQKDTVAETGVEGGQWGGVVVENRAMSVTLMSVYKTPRNKQEEIHVFWALNQLLSLPPASPHFLSNSSIRQ
jgi:hypothetical protein